VANQLGDDLRVVSKVCAHWLPGKKKDEVNGLDDPEYQTSNDSGKANER
jgi:hypothetical protein